MIQIDRSGGGVGGVQRGIVVEENAHIMSREEAQRRLKSIHQAEAVWAYSTIGGMSLAIGTVALIVGPGNFGLGSTAVLAVVIPAIAAIGWIRLRRVTRTNAIHCPQCSARFDRRALFSKSDPSRWRTGLCPTCGARIIHPDPASSNIMSAP